jgi:hypothetical protein
MIKANLGTLRIAKVKMLMIKTAHPKLALVKQLVGEQTTSHLMTLLTPTMGKL